MFHRLEAGFHGSPDPWSVTSDEFGVEIDRSFPSVRIPYYMDDIEALATEIVDADSVVALTGAGISVPSGVPSFRGADGVWKQFDEGQFTYGRFRRDPAGFWVDRLELQRTMYSGAYEPNAAHRALARVGRSGHLDAIVTQNTDGLHQRAAQNYDDGTTRTGEESRASGDGEDPVIEDSDSETRANDPETRSSISGSRRAVDDIAIVELHGNAHRVRCRNCGRREPADPVFERVEAGDVPPTCTCGGVFKPDVVLFGEQLPESALRRARTFARECDVFLAIGSSLVVHPAASLPRLAASSGATVGIVNLDPTPADTIATYVINEDVTTVLPNLHDHVERLSEDE